MAWLFCNPTDDASKGVASAVAPQFKGKVSFVWVDAVKFGGMTARMGLKADKFPSLALDHEGEHFAFPEDQALTA